MKKNTKLLAAAISAVAVLGAGLAVVLSLPSQEEDVSYSEDNKAILLFDHSDDVPVDITVINESGEMHLLGFDYSEHDEIKPVSSEEESESEPELYEASPDEPLVTSADEGTQTSTDEGTQTSADSEASSDETSDGIKQQQFSKPESSQSSEQESSQSETSIDVVYTMQEYPSEDLDKAMTDSLYRECLYFSALRIVDKSDSRYGEYGLDKAKAEVKIVYDNGEQAGFRLGDYAPDRKGVYAVSDGSRYVYLIQSGMVDMFFTDRLQYIDKIMTEKNDDYVYADSVRISGRGYEKDIEVIKGGGVSDADYSMTLPYNEICNNETANDLLTAFNGMTAGGVAAAEADDEAIKSFGLDQPYMKITVKSPDDNTLTLSVSEKDKDGIVYMMTDTRNTIFRHEADALAWYNIQVKDLCSDVVIRPDTEILNSMKVFSGGSGEDIIIKHEKVLNKRYEETLRSTAYRRGKEINIDKVTAFVNAIAGMKRGEDAPEKLPDDAQLLLSCECAFDETNITTDFKVYGTGSDKAVIELNGRLECMTDRSYLDNVIKCAAELKSA